MATKKEEKQKKEEGKDVKKKEEKKSAPKKVARVGGRSKKSTGARGKAFVSASFNNTIITLTDLAGNTVAASSPGHIGYSGSRKSTAYAATRAAEDAADKGLKAGLKSVQVYIKGPGPGRTAAVKGLVSGGIKVTSLDDVTPLPHNGCRARKRPRN